MWPLFSYAYDMSTKWTWSIKQTHMPTFKFVSSNQPAWHTFHPGCMNFDLASYWNKQLLPKMKMEKENRIHDIIDSWANN